MSSPFNPFVVAVEALRERIDAYEDVIATREEHDVPTDSHEQRLADTRKALARFERLAAREVEAPGEGSLSLGNLTYAPEADGALRVDLDGYGVSGRMWMDTAEKVALHRYLGGFVLPKVERFPVGSRTDAAGFTGRPWVDIAVYRTTNRVHVGEKVLTPKGARALAACLQAAADEAEGVANA
jgi:hypothetical protein